MKKRILFLIIICLFTIGHAAGQTFESPVYVGSWRTPFTKTLGLSVEGRTSNNYYYSFTLINALDITVSNCASMTTNSGIFIMDENENVLASDGGLDGNCTTPGLAKVTVGLSPGTYIIWIDWDPLDSHYITTEITGEYPNVTRSAKNIGYYEEDFSYTHSVDTSYPELTYQIPGAYQDGVCYGFTTTKEMNIIVSHCNSEIRDTYIYFLDSKGKVMNFNDNYDNIDACYDYRQAYLVMSNLPPGKYYVVSKGTFAKGDITTQIKGELSKNIPSIMSFSKDIGDYHTFFNYTDTKNTNNYGYPGYGDYRAGVGYCFYLLNDMDVTISHCGSSVSDTHIYLLDIDGEVLYKNDDYSGINACENTKHAYLDVHLQAGIYYAISTGAHSRGNITTQIVGRTTKMNLGSVDKNYVITRTYKDESGFSWQDKLDYHDAMGRPEQTVLTDASPNGGDIVTIQKYDKFGRMTESWLPSVVTDNLGEYVSFNDFIDGTDPDYGPYSFTEYEKSQLDRPTSQYGPGDYWQLYRKAIKTEYQLTNIEGKKLKNCIHYRITNEAAMTDTLVTVKSEGSYPTGTLNAIQIMDEDDNPTITFKNRLGQVILSRQILRDGAELNDTYYLYDDWGNLHAVLPPSAADIMKQEGRSWNNASDEVMRNYAYLYKYDKRFRVIAKRLPGQDWIYYVYDKSDTPIFAQDGEQRKRGEWSFTITDGLNRICLTGICKNHFEVSSNSLNTAVNAIRDNSVGIFKGYSVTGITLVEPQILTVKYYDDYNFMGNNGMPASTDVNFKYDIYTNYNYRYTNGAQSLLTGALTAQLNGGDTISYLPSVMYYDYQGRLIQCMTGTQLTGGVEKEFTAYDFTGKPIKKRLIHIAAQKQTETEEYNYTYDYMDRLLKKRYTLTNKGTIALADNEYDKWGRLITNKHNGNLNLKTDYTYNVRSWVKTISNPLFSQRLYYNDLRDDESNISCYNGNISAMDWITVPDSIHRGYNFTYDGLSQLKKANYLENNIASNKFRTSYEYYKQGNIMRLKRYGQTDYNSYDLIDDLTFTMNGNQLINVDDAATHSAYLDGFEFKDSIGQDTEYLYDANGNLIKDLNKKIADIQYNLLNLPCLLKFEDGSTITYTYDANGKKLRTVHKIGENITTKDYCGNVIFENGKAKLLLTEAGYITLTDKKHHFFLQDHQGNNRVVADENGNIEEVNHYYPFGGTFAGSTSVQPYKYNGKELDRKNGLNWYDYGARHYDAALGRWHVMDPMAEKYYGISPYAYCNNNPVNLIDPTGNVFTRYQDQYGNLLANTNDGSHKVVTVPNSRIDEFKKHLLYASDYLQSSQGWNNYWTDEFKGTEAFKPTPEQQAVLDMQHSDWARKNGIEYLKEPNLWNWLKYVGSEVLSQYTDPELVAGGLSAGIMGLNKPIVQNSEYTFTKSAGKHMSEFVKKGMYKGELSRPYMNWSLPVNEIMATGKGVPDATFKGGMNWRAPGYFRNQQGIWELGINPKTKVIYHFNFTN